MAINAAGIDRLKSQLLTSGLSQKDQPLFQIINTLIDAARQSLGDSATALAGSSSGGSAGPAGADGEPGATLFGMDGGIDEIPDIQMPFTQGLNPNFVTVTTTGNIDDLDVGNADTVYMNNASLATIRGIKSRVNGKPVEFISIGAGEVHFAHENAGSVAENRLTNSVTSGITPLAAGSGAASYLYNSATGRWRLVRHYQGAWINVAHNAGNFTATGGATWTVDAADQQTFAYYLVGKVLILTITLSNTAITVAAPLQLNITVPNSYTFSHINRGPISIIDGGAGEVGMFSMSVAGTQIQCFKTPLGVPAWTIGAVNLYYCGFVMVT